MHTEAVVISNDITTLIQDIVKCMAINNQLPVVNIGIV